MGNHATIDIETIAQPGAIKLLKGTTFSPKPKTLVDPKKIEASIAEQRQEALEKFPLHWTTAQVICLSVVTDDDQPLCWYGEDEAKILTAFGEYLRARPWTILCGAYTKDFDIPLLAGRYMALELGVPDQLRLIEPHKIQDVNQIFGYSQSSGQRGSLNKYAQGLNIPGKIGHGGQVSDWYNKTQLGDNTAWEQLAQYCIQDSLIAHEMLSRYKKPFGTKPDEATIITPPF